MRRDGGVVDTDVEPAEALQRRIDDALCAGLAADVGHQRRHALLTNAAHVSARPSASRSAASTEAPAAAKRRYHHAANAARRASHDHDTICEIKRNGHWCTSSLSLRGVLKMAQYEFRACVL